MTHRSMRGKTTRRIPDTERAFMFELHEKGLSNREVAEETGYSYSATTRILREMEMQKQRRPQVAVEVVQAPEQSRQHSATEGGSDELREVQVLLNTIEELAGREARAESVDALTQILFHRLQRLMFPNLG